MNWSTTTRKGSHGKGKVMSEKLEVQLAQALTNERILSQLDAIGKRLSVVENSVFAAWPKPKISV